MYAYFTHFAKKYINNTSTAICSREAERGQLYGKAIDLYFSIKKRIYVMYDFTSFYGLIGGEFWVT